MTLKKVSTAEGIVSYAQSSAKFYALKLINDKCYSFYEADDLEQEILALFLYQIKRYPYDLNKSSEKHWISIIMENIYKNLKSKAIRESKYISKVSLNDSITNSSRQNNNEQINESEIIDFIQDDKSNTFETYCKQKTKEKITKAIEDLPNDLKDICRYLQTDNVSDISKKLNISRKTIYQKIHKIKSIFEKCGIDKDWDL
ncbi:MAG TPA: HTH domain-containing protein [Rickettsiales bacterium]|nr:HTH domain-containing protein [Rickettsiales bacterium]